MRNLQVSFKGKENNEALSISLEGHLTSMSAINFKRDLLHMLNERETDCYIDISKLDAMDLSGVNAITIAHKQLETDNRKMYLVSNSENPAMEFLHLTKFNRYLNFLRA